jgi:tetratricopeptide (TPR) repeat protein
MGNQDRAIAIYEAVLPRLIALNGEASVDVATTLRNLGISYHKAERFVEAQETYDRSRAAYNAVNPDGKEILARLDHDQALLLLDQDRPAEAEPFARRALAVFERELQPTDVRVTTAASTLARIYTSLGRPDEAERYRAYEAGQ